MKSKKIPTCNNIRYREFPDLLFGMSDDGSEYFDATHYIQKKGNINIHTVEKFEKEFVLWIKPVVESFSIPPEEVFIKQESAGHLMIEESLALLFVAYLDPEFVAYMLDRMSEMLIAGIVLSDTTLMMMVRNRFSDNEIIDFTDKK